MTATTLSIASSTLVTPASVLEPIILAAQSWLNTTTHNDYWINSRNACRASGRLNWSSFLDPWPQ
ncbi:hypothetical protein CROQUDRAFT_97661 [Cronartium quercuum f. sp. fusiforme G11]|uniref:Uncharacterized protein n=1 Tax=Cronartium quercuum f. sp. fusiforme G11 TaxID=708437 RepID=A0A9P6NEL8_9BASI|nr:hypothetical protein CROQUDRAFT_97661 [Cronartium quercuum f. sp. fusiforme G11]